MSLVHLFRRDHIADPYPLYAALRDEAAVHWDAPLRSWTVFRYDDIKALAQHPALSNDRVTPFAQRMPDTTRRQLEPLATALSDMMLFTDAPRHTRLRAPLRPHFTPRAAERLRHFVRGQVDALIHDLPRAEPVDLLTRLAQPLTRIVISRLLGIPEDQRHLLRNWQSLLDEFFLRSPDEIDRVLALRKAYDSFPANDIPPIHDDWSDDERFAAYLLLVDAGQATTTHFLTNAIRSLLENPDQLRLLRTRPDLLPAALPELLRYESPVQFMTRNAIQDFHFGGCDIERGQQVTLVLAAGNRDPRAFRSPDTLDLTRPARHHLSFGHGAHYCLGANLTFVEVETVLTALLRHAPGMRPHWTELEWEPTINFRFLTELPVLLGG